MASKKDIAEALADRDWWRRVAAVLGMTLYGFSNRSSAVLRRAGGTHFDCPGDVAEKALELSASPASGALQELSDAECERIAMRRDVQRLLGQYKRAADAIMCDPEPSPNHFGRETTAVRALIRAVARALESP